MRAGLGHAADQLGQPRVSARARRASHVTERRNFLGAGLLVFDAIREAARGGSVAAAALAGAGFLWLPPGASAQTNQVGIFQDDVRMLTAPGPTLLTLRELGVGVVRVTLAWSTVAPAQRPAGGVQRVRSGVVPGGQLGIYDQIVRDAHTDGIAVDFSLTGPAPLWASAPGVPAGAPSATQALGSRRRRHSASSSRRSPTRYSGSYDPTVGAIVHGSAGDLPRVAFWELWNEPNFGQDLAPQAIKGSSVPTRRREYRNLLEAGWSALGLTGHGRDTILIGNLAARGTSGKPSHRLRRATRATSVRRSRSSSSALCTASTRPIASCEARPLRRWAARRTPPDRAASAGRIRRCSAPPVRDAPVPDQPAPDPGELHRS